MVIPCRLIDFDLPDKLYTCKRSNDNDTLNDAFAALRSNAATLLKRSN